MTIRIMVDLKKDVASVYIAVATGKLKAHEGASALGIETCDFKSYMEAFAEHGCDMFEHTYSSGDLIVSRDLAGWPFE